MFYGGLGKHHLFGLNNSQMGIFKGRYLPELMGTVVQDRDAKLWSRNTADQMDEDVLKI